MTRLELAFNLTDALYRLFSTGTASTRKPARSAQSLAEAVTATFLAMLQTSFWKYQR
jgi:hypothetical protein